MYICHATHRVYTGLLSLVGRLKVPLQAHLLLVKITASSSHAASAAEDDDEAADAAVTAI